MVEWVPSKSVFVWNSIKVFETELNTVLRTEDNYDKLYMACLDHIQRT